MGGWVDPTAAEKTNRLKSFFRTEAIWHSLSACMYVCMVVILVPLLTVPSALSTTNNDKWVWFCCLTYIHEIKQRNLAKPDKLHNKLHRSCQLPRKVVELTQDRNAGLFVSMTSIIFPSRTSHNGRHGMVHTTASRPTPLKARHFGNRNIRPCICRWVGVR